ncbi:response regulator [Desulfuromonas acetoxidans]|uniref:Response regulator receiver protein n=1 Tax=Desulfuromonas acetoxidans (strain DSM 684 / 11070) TaxID=281689 RepID=Q1JVS0_DESA6|nr:response regulator [Desulfuromonas acetoxidans]EAT14334.1 response regulator receiver protein [Desulfuromonas acetoxidans DSM 684]MBF0646773.1 response regulator [Desulfuromonas acetoxidans]NVD24458.1 response regulator [Desulfuromonas acetoxidans]NVE16593.1 response regulator [Desulfuromonas acetoxidans]
MSVEDKKTILVVDDSPTVRRLVELVLTQNGYEVLSAEDGEKGLEMARQHLPSVVLVDFVMPKMNGHMFCKMLREDDNLKDVPVILISSKSEVVGHAFEASFGIVHYFTKPFEPEDLVAKIREVSAEASGETVVEERVEPAAESASTQAGSPSGLSGSSEDIDKLLDSLNDRFDKVVRRYFQKDFPVLMKNVMSDTLKETGLIKHQTLILSGDLTRMELPELLTFCANTRQSGRLSIFSNDTFAEIFIDNGKFVFATASQKGKHCFLTDLICQDNRFSCDTLALQRVVEEARQNNQPIGRALVEKELISEEDLMYYLRQHAQDALNTAINTHSGNFFLEKDDLPFNLEDISFRIPMYQVLLEGIRERFLRNEFTKDELVVTRLPLCIEASQEGLLSEDEQSLTLLLDGTKTLGQVCEESTLDDEAVRKCCQVLYQAGLASAR